MAFKDWTKNATLSLKYAGINYLKNQFKMTDKLINSLKDSKDIFKTEKEDLSQQLREKVWDKAIKEGYKNILTAGKTGKFVPDAEEEERRMMKAMGFDMDEMENFEKSLDTSFMDEEDIDTGEGTISDEEGSSNMSEEDGDVLENNKTTLNIFQADNAKVGKAIIATSSKLNQTLNQSLSFQTKGMLASNNRILSQLLSQSKYFDSIYKGITGVNDGVVSMANELSGHKNAMEQLTIATRDAVVQLQEINKSMQVQLSVYGRTADGEIIKRRTYERDPMFDSEGNFNASAYVKTVAERIRNEISITDMIAPIFSNLSSTIVDMITSGTGEKLGLNRAFKRLDKYIGNLPNLVFGRLEEFMEEHEGKNSILDFFMGKMDDIFGRREFGRSLGDALSTENLATAFDTYTKKSIVEVIPGLLSKILNKLPDNPNASIDNEVMMDFKSGTWTTKGKKRQKIQEDRKWKTFSGTEAMTGEMDRILNSMEYSSPEQREAVRRELADQFMMLSRQKGNIGSKRFKFDEFLERNTPKELREAMKNWYSNMSNDKRNVLVKDAASVRSNMDSWLTDIEEDPTARLALADDFNTDIKDAQQRTLDQLQMKIDKLARDKGSESERLKLMEQFKKERKKMEEINNANLAFRTSKQTLEDRKLIENVSSGPIMTDASGKEITPRSSGIRLKTNEDGTPIQIIDEFEDKTGFNAQLPSLYEMIRHPFQSLAAVTDKVTNTLGKFFFGDKDDPNSLSGMFNSVKEWTKENIFKPFKENVWEPLTTSINEHLLQPVKNTFNKVADATMKAVDESVFQPIKNAVTTGIKALFGKKEGEPSLGERITGYFRSDKTIGGQVMGWVKKNQKGLIQGGGAALVGTIVTGGNPILGLMIGAGVGYVQSSEKAREYLFGDEGKLRPAINFFKKYGAKMGVGAGIGFIAGGPVGAILGASAGFALQTDKVKKFLWGDDGVMNKAKKWFNNHNKQIKGAGIGALAGLMVAGPFGALLGAVGGFVLMTNKVQEYLFGKDGEGGAIRNMFNRAKEYLFGKDGVLTNAWDRVKTMLFGKEDKKGLFTGFGNYLKNKWDELVDFGKNQVMEPMKRFFVNQVVNPLKGTLAPFLKEFQLKLIAFKDSMVQGIKSGFKAGAGWVNNMFGKLYGKTLSELMEEKIVKPFKNFFGGLWKRVTGFLGTSIRGVVQKVRTKSDELRAKHEAKGIKYADTRLQGFYDKEGKFQLTGRSKKFSYDEQVKRQERLKQLKELRSKGKTLSEANKEIDIIGQEKEKAKEMLSSGKADPVQTATIRTNEKVTEMVDETKTQTTLLQDIKNASLDTVIALKDVATGLGVRFKAVAQKVTGSKKGAKTGRIGMKPTSSPTAPVNPAQEAKDVTREVVTEEKATTPTVDNITIPTVTPVVASDISVPAPTITMDTASTPTTGSSLFSGGGKYGLASPEEGAGAAVFIADRLDKVLPAGGGGGSEIADTIGGLFGGHTAAIRRHTRAIAIQLGCDPKDLDKPASSIGGKIGGFFNKLKNWITKPFKAIKDVADKVLKLPKELIKLGSTLVSNLWTGIKSISKGLLTVGTSLVKGVWEGTKAVAKGAWEVTKVVTPVLWEGVKTVSKSLWEVGKTLVKGVWETGKSLTKGLYTISKDVIKGGWEVIKAITPALWSATKAVTGAVWEMTKTVVPALWSATKAVVKGLWQGVKAIGGTAIKGVKGVWDMFSNKKHSSVNVTKQVEIVNPVPLPVEIVKSIILATTDDATKVSPLKGPASYTPTGETPEKTISVDNAGSTVQQDGSKPLTLRERAKNFGRRILGGFQDFGSKTKRFFTSQWNSTKNFFGNIFGKKGEKPSLVTSLIETVTSAITGPISSLKETISNKFLMLRERAENFGQRILGGFQDLGSKTKRLFISTWTSTKNFFGKIFGGFQDLGSKTKRLFISTWTSTKNFFGKIFGKEGKKPSLVTSLIKSTKNFGQRIFGGFQDFFGKIFGKEGKKPSLVTSLIKSTKNFGQRIFGGFQDFFGKKGENTSPIKDVASAVTGPATSLKETISNKFLTRFKGQAVAITDIDGKVVDKVLKRIAHYRRVRAAKNKLLRTMGLGALADDAGETDRDGGFLDTASDVADTYDTFRGRGRRRSWRGRGRLMRRKMSRVWRGIRGSKLGRGTGRLFGRIGSFGSRAAGSIARSGIGTAVRGIGTRAAGSIARSGIGTAVRGIGTRAVGSIARAGIGKAIGGTLARVGIGAAAKGALAAGGTAAAGGAGAMGGLAALATNPVTLGVAAAAVGGLLAYKGIKGMSEESTSELTGKKPGENTFYDRSRAGTAAIGSALTFGLVSKKTMFKLTKYFPLLSTMTGVILTGLKTTWKILKFVLKVLLWPLKMAAKGIAVVCEGIGKGIDKVFNFFSWLGEKILVPFKAIWSGIKDGLSSVWESISGTLGEIWKSLKDTFYSIVEPFVEVGKGIYNGVKKIWEMLFGKGKKEGESGGVMKFISTFVKGLFLPLKWILKGVGSLAKGIGWLVSAPFKLITAQVKLVIKGIGAVASGLGSVVKWIVSVPGKLWGMVKRGISKIWPFSRIFGGSSDEEENKEKIKSTGDIANTIANKGKAIGLSPESKSNAVTITATTAMGDKSFKDLSPAEKDAVYGLNMVEDVSKPIMEAAPVTPSQTITPAAVNNVQQAVKLAGQSSYNGPLGAIINALNIIAQNTSHITEIPDAMARTKIQVNMPETPNAFSNNNGSSQNTINSNFFANPGGKKRGVSEYRSAPENVIAIAGGL